MVKVAEKMPWDGLSEKEIQGIAIALDRSAYAPLAHELGRFITQWAAMEQSITLLLQKVTVSTDALDFTALTGQLDVYSKCRALLALSKRRKLPDGWHKTLKNLCSYIDGSLRQHRNRLVHDAWLIEDGVFTRLTYRPRALDGDIPLSAVDETPVTPLEIREACARVFLARGLSKRLFEQLDT